MRKTLAFQWLLRACSIVGLALVFTIATGAAVVLHLDLPAGRRFAAGALTSLLGQVFQGKLTIGAIDHIHARHVEASDITVKDQAGRTVLSVTRLRAEADVFDVVYKILWGGPKTTLVIDHARVERAEAWIVPSPNTGIPTLAEALTPRETPAKPGQPSESRYVRVWLPIVEVGRGFARGQVGALPILEADVSNVRGSVLASPKGAAIDIPKFSLVGRGILGTDARGIASLHIRAPGAVWSSLDGYLGEVQFASVVRYDKQRLDVTLDAPRASPASARALWPDWPLHKDASLHIEAAGTPPKLDVKGRFDVEGSSVTANGMVDLSGTLGADLDVEARALDLRAVLPDAPETSLNLFANVSMANSAGHFVADVKGQTEATNIAGIALPATEIAGTYDQSGFQGRATVHEQGLPFRVSFTVKPNGTVDLEADSDRFEASKAPRLEPYLAARGLTRANVKAHIEDKQLDAEFALDVQGFELGEVRLESAKASGRAKGSLENLERLNLDATLRGRGLHAGRFGFDTVSASAKGSAARPLVTVALSDAHGPSVTAKAHVQTGSETRIEKLELEIQRDQASLRGRVERLDLGEGVVVVRQLALSGAGGELTGELELRPGLFQVEAKGENLDLDAMARILGLPRGQIGGRVRVEAELVAAKDVRRGRIRLGLGNAAIGPLTGTSLSLRASLDGDDFGGDISGQVAALGAFGAVWDTRLAGPITELESYERATGSIEIQAQDLDLSYVAQLLPAGVGIESIAGRGAGTLRLKRDDPKSLPSISLLAETRGLSIERETPSGTKQAPPRINGLDLKVSAHIDGETGDSDAAVQLTQGASTLAGLSAKAELDLPRVRGDPAQLGPMLAETPLLAKLVIEQRSFESLPEPLRLPGMQGNVRAEATLRGTYLEPVFDAKVELGNVRVGAAEAVEPIDVCAELEYDKQNGRFAGKGQVFLPAPLGAHKQICSGRRVAQLSAGGTARWDDLTGPGDGEAPRWTGSAGAMLEGLPLGAIAPLAEAHFTGQAYGAVMFERTQTLPQLSAKLELRQARVDRMPIGDGKIIVHTGGKTLRTEIDFSRDGGALKAQMLSALNWDGIVPGFDDTQPVTASVQARKVDAAIIEPLLTDFFTDLSGSLDANFALRLAPLPKTEKGPRWTGHVSGTLSMEDGMVQLSGLALRLSDVKFHAVAETDQDTTLVIIPDLQAKALSSTDNLAASAKLRLKGLDIVSGTAQVEIRELPLVVEGVSHATASGKLGVELRRLNDEMNVGVKIADLKAELPRSSARNLIQIDDNPSIELLHPVREPRPARSSDAMPWRFQLDLGSRTRITRTDLLLPISGRPEILLAEETEITGDIELNSGGRLQLLGKSFTIEAGEVHFDTGDSENPRLQVLASWRAPDATTVYVELSGEFRKPTMRLSSDPQKPEAEIQALLLGGSTGEEGGDVAASGIGAGADVLGALLADTPLNKVHLRTANEQTADQRAYSSYTAAYQASDTIVVEGSYKDLRSTDPSNEDKDALSGAVDWRFHKNWSLRTEVGTIGTGLDLLWQYRY